VCRADVPQEDRVLPLNPIRVDAHGASEAGISRTRSTICK
jgi:hypothetical protein